MRIAVAVGLLFALMHFVIESEFFEEGPLSKKGLIHLMDLKTLDLKFQSRKDLVLPPPQVVIAAIDEKSVERFGLWPWGRDVIAQFIDVATKGGAKVIGFDAVFSDEDKNSSYMTIKKFLGELEEASLAPGSTPAAQLAERLQEAQRCGEDTQKFLADVERRAPNKGLSKAAAQARDAAGAEGKALTAAHAALAQWQSAAAQYVARIKSQTLSRSPDDALAEAISHSPQTILGYFNFYAQQEIVGIAPFELANDFARVEASAIEHIYESRVKDVGGQEVEILEPAQTPISKLQIRPVIALRPPLKKLAAGATAFGYFNVSPDPDGPMRRVRLVNRYQNKLYPALSLVAAARALDGEIRPINGSIKPGRTLDGVSLAPGVMVPTDLHGRVLVN